MLEVTINGERRQIDQPVTIADLMDQLGYDRRRLAIELNREVVRRADWDNTAIKQGDKLEIVHFVGGGLN